MQTNKLSSLAFAIAMVSICSTMSFAAGAAGQLPGTLKDIKVPAVKAAVVVDKSLKAGATKKSATLRLTCEDRVNVLLTNNKAYVNGTALSFNLQGTALPTWYLITLYDRSGRDIYGNLKCQGQDWRTL